MKKIRISSEISLEKINKNNIAFSHSRKTHLITKNFIKKLATRLVEFDKSIPVKKNGEVNWSKVKSGTPFVAQINGMMAIGKIQKEKRISEKEDETIYLCQNKQDGSSCYNKLGYKSSWTIGNGTLDEMASSYVNLISFKDGHDSKKDNKRKTIGKLGGFYSYINNGFIEVGCQGISNFNVRKLVELIDLSEEKTCN